MSGRPSTKTLLERFEAKCCPEPNTGCWLWFGARNSHGYGHMQGAGGRLVTATKIAWELFVGAIPKGGWLLHTCDTPECVNPAHLYVGDSIQNALDRVKRDRMPRGERHHATKFGKEVVALILKAKSGCEAARQFGISFGTACRIRRGGTWRREVEALNNVST